jgi:transposase InsO family protein
MEKGETLGVFKEFKALVEKQVGVPIQILRTDRGVEYLSIEFAEFCSEHGIQRQLTASYTPQQNGVAERKKPDYYKYGSKCFSRKTSSVIFLVRSYKMGDSCVK